MIGNSIEHYFNEVQEIMKQLVIDEHNIKADEADQFVQDLICQQPNVQIKIKQIVNTNCNANIQPLKTAEIIINRYFNHPVVNNSNKIDNLSNSEQDIPNQMSDDRVMNTNENKLKRFKDFL